LHYFSRILRYVLPYRALAIATVVIVVLSGLTGLLLPWPLKVLVDNALGSQPMPRLIRWFVGTGDGYKLRLLLWVVIGGLALVLLDNLLSVLHNYVTTKLDLNMVLDFRSDLFGHVERLAMTYHDSKRSGMLIYAVNFQAASLAGVVMTLPPLAHSAITLVGMFWISMHIDPKLALLSLVVMPFLYFLVGFYVTYIQARIRRVKELEGESLSIIHEAVSMLRVIVAFGREDHEYDRFRNQGERTVNARVALTLRQAIFSMVVNVTVGIGTALVLGFGAYDVMQHKLTIGGLLVLLGYIASIYKPLEAISNTIGSLQDQFVNLQFAFHVLDHPARQEDAPGAIAIGRARGDLTFQDVRFDYPQRQGTLRDINLSVNAGEVVAIVGPTGAGKTTLMSLIPRFYEATGGRILLDGREMRSYTLESLRRLISIVLQEPLLFSGTIADNIRYGKLDATPEQILDAARAANAHEFIVQLPKGYDTEVGERGAQLSGGERQRICIARAFLKDAPILILDEPTSAIDSKTETVILDALDHLMVGRTTLLIAHRLSTIGRASKIVVIDHGRIVQQGSHTRLLAEGGLYAQMWQLQSSHRQDDDAEPPADGNGKANGHLIATERAPAIAGSKKIVVLGMLTKMPVAGVYWQTAHYLVGLQRLGYQAYYVEAHGRTPSSFMETPQDNSSVNASQFIADFMRRIDLPDRWAFHALHDDGEVYGMSRMQLQQLYDSAALIINLHGGTHLSPEQRHGGSRMFLETDPVEMQIELAKRDAKAVQFLEPHDSFFTFGENYGMNDCKLPTNDRFVFKPTRQPVVLDFWRKFANGSGGPNFTTIGNWKQPWREIEWDGEVYHWSKHLEFMKFVDLPGKTTQPLELALSSYEGNDRKMLESKGWKVRPAMPFSTEPDRYRRYIAESRGEFTVAKDQNVRMRSGWFSDRSATYLACGRPVITQDTGFGSVLPTGEGLFAFSSLDDILAAIERVNSDYPKQRRAAQAIAQEYFSHDTVLPRLLKDSGI
jgi:ATP-binding cassette subfamily B protein/subfamily B ATP-binding cassette protein MsbA